MDDSRPGSSVNQVLHSMNTPILLKEACDFILDGTHGSPERVREGIPVLSAQNVIGGRLSFDTERFTTTAEY
jgi:hypothetical protein